MAKQTDLLSGGASVHSKEVRDRFAEKLESYQRATTLLRPDEVAGDYDAGRLLQTSLGGYVRTITPEDLQRFKRMAEALGKRYVGGITAKSVIEMSTPADRERCNQQIRVAVPTQRRGNDVHFVTNAGPDSDVIRHHVHVQFLGLSPAIAAPSAARDLAKKVAAGRLMIQCDCSHWQYRFSYIATIGKYNAGRPIDGYPKLTNPRLIGVACKHVLRVMQVLKTPMVQQYVERMIDEGRRALKPKNVATLKKDATALAQLQRQQASRLRNTVESSAERKDRLARQRAVREVVERTKKTMMPKNPAQMAAARRKFEQSARLLAQMGGISQKQLADMLAKLNGRKT